MKQTKLFISLIGIVLGLLAIPGFAVELNSTNITQEPFNCNINDTICLLGYNSITSIASGTFSNHTDLEVLRLNNNQLTGIDVGDFYGLNNITELLLDHNSISSIESGAFSMNGLLQLNLGNNEILNVSDWIGSVPSNMTHLWLNNNNIQNVGGGIFDSLANLGFLFLTDNQIVSVGASDFSSVSNLSVLSLSDNRVCTIEEGSFVGLNNISQIWIHNNYLTVGEVDSTTADILDNNEPPVYYGFPDWRDSQVPDTCAAGGGCTDSENPDATRLCFIIQEGTNTCTWNEISYSFGSYNVNAAVQHTGINNLGYSCELYANAAVTITLSDANLSGAIYTIDASNLTGDASGQNFTEDGSLTAGASWSTSNSQMTSQELYTKTEGQIGNIIQYFNVDLTVPAGQPADSYTADLTITIS